MERVEDEMSECVWALIVESGEAYSVRLYARRSCAVSTMLEVMRDAGGRRVEPEDGELARCDLPDGGAWVLTTEVEP